MQRLKVFSIGATLVLLFSCQSGADVRTAATDITSSTNIAENTSQKGRPLPVKSEDDRFIRSLIDRELIELRSTVNDLKGQKDEESMWLESDLEYYSLWLKGVQNEKNGNYSAALNFYRKALNTTRHEMSSFHVKLSMGRTYIATEEYRIAIQRLTEFIEEAREEIKNNGEDLLWSMTEEGIAARKKEIRHAQKLIEIAKKRL